MKLVFSDVLAFLLSIGLNFVFRRLTVKIGRDCSVSPWLRCFCLSLTSGADEARTGSNGNILPLAGSFGVDVAFTYQ